ncbi:MAG: hypothetical protein WA738_04495 [Candidatus Angelobacter sp.]
MSKKKSHPVLWVLLIIFVGLVILASLNRSSKPEDKSVSSAPLLPTPFELQNAEKAGLSKEFASQGWILHRYSMNKFMPLAGYDPDEGLKLPPDDDLRASLTKLKDVQHTEADKVAFQRMAALVWATHTASQLRSRGSEDLAYKQAYHMADDCFIAVDTSFRGGTGGAAANAVHRCLIEQPKVKADLNKQGVSTWNSL